MSDWILTIIIGGLGMLLIIANLIGLVLNVRKKQKGSVVPFVGAILIVIAGLLSPIKWLSIFFILDPSIWLFLYSAIKTKGFQALRVRTYHQTLVEWTKSRLIAFR